MIPAWLNNKDTAHRGLHDKNIPENSLEAFQKAINYGFNIELDVQLSKDNVPVVFHDFNLKRMTGYDKDVNQLTLSEIKQLRLLDDPAAVIPTLEETLRLCQGKTGLLIEIKKLGYDFVSYAEEDVILPVLQRYKGDFIVKSFNPFTVDYFGRYAPEFVRGFLSSVASIEDYAPAAREVVERLLFSQDKRVDFFDYYYPLLGSELYNMVDLPLVVWTINNIEDYNKVKPLTISCIFEGFIPPKAA